MSQLRAVPDPIPDVDGETLSLFGEWLSAVEAAAALRDAMKGRRVRYVGLFRNAASPVEGTIKDVTSSGFKVLWDGTQRTDWVHPDGVMFI